MPHFPPLATEMLRRTATPLNPWHIAWRSRWLFLAGTATGLALGLLLYRQLPSVYQSQAQVLIWLKQPNAITSVESRSGVVEDSLATHQDLLKSSRILADALRDPRLQAAGLTAEGDAAVEAIRKQLFVTRGKTSGAPNNVLQLALRGSNTDDCPLLLAAILGSYQRFLELKYRNYSVDTIERVLRERAELEKELTRKESAYQHFLEGSPLLMKKADGSDLRRDRLTVIQTKRSALLLRGSELRTELDSIETARREGRSRATLLALIAEFAQHGDASDTPRSAGNNPIADQLTPLLLEEQKLLERYGPGHPEVRSMRKRIAIARAHLVLPATAWDKPSAEAAAAPPSDPVELHLQILRRKLEHITRAEEQLNRLFAREHEEARQQARYEIQDEAHHNGILLTRQAYDALNKRLQDVSLVKNAGGYDVEVITPPSPSQKVSPSGLLLFPGSALLGALAGLALGFLRALTNTRPLAGNRGRTSVAVAEDDAHAEVRNVLTRTGPSD